MPSSKTKKPFFIVIPAGLAGCAILESSPIGIPTEESALSLNVNYFLSVLGFRFTTSQIPCHA